MEINQKKTKVSVSNKPKQIKNVLPKVEYLLKKIEEDCNKKCSGVIFSNRIDHLVNRQNHSRKSL